MRETTYGNWPIELRIARGLVNGYRVVLARESRGMQRYQLARKLHIPAKELAHRETGWHFWSEQEYLLLAGLLSYPLAFFMQDDPPQMLNVFVCGHTEDDEPWCEHLKELR